MPAILTRPRPYKFPLIREAREIFRRGGTKALEKWVARLPFDKKSRLASQIITLLAAQSGRDPAEIALEILRGKGSIQ